VCVFTSIGADGIYSLDYQSFGILSIGIKSLHNQNVEVCI